MKKITAVLLISSLPYNAFANCAKDKEIEALDFRAIQSSMMVAALSCDMQNEYNQFMDKYKKKISQGSSAIKSYFKRIYGESSDRRLNTFMTRIANNATKESMTGAPDDYCNETGAAFKELLNSKTNNLADFKSRDKYSSIHGFNSCS